MSKKNKGKTKNSVQFLLEKIAEDCNIDEDFRKVIRDNDNVIVANKPQKTNKKEGKK